MGDSTDLLPEELQEMVPSRLMVDLERDCEAVCVLERDAVSDADEEADADAAELTLRDGLSRALYEQLTEGDALLLEEADRVPDPRGVSDQVSDGVQADE